MMGHPGWIIFVSCAVLLDIIGMRELFREKVFRRPVDLGCVWGPFRQPILLKEEKRVDCPLQTSSLTSVSSSIRIH
jgi:hypothetical protein